MLTFIKGKRLILHFHAWENARYTLNGKIEYLEIKSGRY